MQGKEQPLTSSNGLPQTFFKKKRAAALWNKINT